jgi:hypothetical protein
MDVNVDVYQTPEDDYMGSRPEFCQYSTGYLYISSTSAHHRQAQYAISSTITDYFCLHHGSHVSSQAIQVQDGLRENLHKY